MLSNLPMHLLWFSNAMESVRFRQKLHLQIGGPLSAIASRKDREFENQFAPAEVDGKRIDGLPLIEHVDSILPMRLEPPVQYADVLFRLRRLLTRQQVAQNELVRNMANRITLAAL